MPELNPKNDPALNEALNCAPDLCIPVLGLAEQCNGDMEHFLRNHVNLICDRYILSVCKKCGNKTMTAVIDD